MEKHSADMKKITIDMLKMQQQLSYEQSHEYDKDLASIEEALQKHKDRLSELEQQTEKIQRAKATLESKAASEVAFLKLTDTRLKLRLQNIVNVLLASPQSWSTSSKLQMYAEERIFLSSQRSQGNP